MHAHAPSRRTRRHYPPQIIRQIVADTVATATSEVDREYTLADHWDLVSHCWPRERKTVMREIMYHRYSWF